MAGQLLHQEGAAAEFHNHSNRISTTAAVAAAAAVRADSACSSSRQPLSRNLRQSSQVQLIPWSAHSRCRCWLLEKETRRERDQSWNRALGREREREPCSGRQVGENAVGVTSCKTLSVAVTFLEAWLLVGWLSITK